MKATGSSATEGRPRGREQGPAFGGVDGKAGTIRGYASLFGPVDMVGDSVAPGAFTASIARRGAEGVRMLWQHEPGRPIGVWTRIEEDRHGLLVEGRLALGTEGGREAFALLAAGAVDGLSIGFKTKRAERASGVVAGGKRRLVEIDLWEISVVTFPMQERARVIETRTAGAEGGCLLQQAALAGQVRAAAAGLRALARRT